jgi:protein phosphatase
MHFVAHGISHKGKVRETNADRFLVGSIRRTFLVDAISDELTPPAVPEDGGPGGTIMLVADGIGSSRFGHEAASLTINSIVSHFASPLKLQRSDVSLEDDIVDQFAQMIIASHQKLEEAVRDNPEMKGMATTLTLAFVLGSRAWIAHVGDSRAYLVRGGSAMRLTKDQTVAQMLVDRGVLDERSAESSRLAHILSSAIGGSGDAMPSVLSYRVALEPGDALLLCTDGLTKHVTEETMTKVTAESAMPTEACSQLLRLALDGGGSDNITVVVGRMVD